MAELGKIRKQIKKAQDIFSVVRTMKSIAAVNIRHYEKAVRSVRDYFHSVELGFQILVHHQPQMLPIKDVEIASNKIGAIIIGSERGMCGDFNDRLHHYFTFSLREEKEMEQLHILSLGDNIAYRLEHFPNQQNFAFPSSFEGISELLWKLLDVIDAWREKHAIEKIILFHNRMVSASTYEPDKIEILPMSSRWLEELRLRQWESRSLPVFSASWESLFADLMQEYIYISMYRGFAESLASENASRLLAMQSAEKNIGDHLKEIQKKYHLQRQNSITEELFDVLAGFELLKGKKRK